MLLNQFEFILMNNPLRAFIQENYEIKKLRKMTDVKDINTALEIGCGNGRGAHLIKRYFSPAKLSCIDLDDRMIKLASKRNHDCTINFDVMDAANLLFEDNYFDAVFSLGVIHHIPRPIWKDSIKQIFRVLKPGQLLILEELSTETFAYGFRKVWKRLLSHPYDEMFSEEEFTEYIKKTGFEMLQFKKATLLGFRHFSLVARKINL